MLHYNGLPPCLLETKMVFLYLFRALREHSGFNSRPTEHSLAFVDYDSARTIQESFHLLTLFGMPSQPIRAERPMVKFAIILKIQQKCKGRNLLGRR